MTQQNVLSTLPPPWAATRQEIAEATRKVGAPIVYQLDKGWVIITQRAAVTLSVFMQFGVNRG